MHYARPTPTQFRKSVMSIYHRRWDWRWHVIQIIAIKLGQLRRYLCKIRTVRPIYKHNCWPDAEGATAAQTGSRPWPDHQLIARNTRGSGKAANSRARIALYFVAVSTIRNYAEYLGISGSFLGRRRRSGLGAKWSKSATPRCIVTTWDISHRKSFNELSYKAIGLD